MKKMDPTLSDAVRTMSDWRREHFLKLISDISLLHEIEDPIYYLYSHFPDNKLDHALIWLCMNRLVGQRFIDWRLNECSGSNLEMHRRLLAAVEKGQLRPILAGKDFKV